MVFEHRKSKKPSLVTFEEFALGYEVRHESILNIDRIAAIARMKELLSAGPGYNEVLFNCEQAARYVSEGKSYSWQIRGAFVFISLIVGLVILSKSEAA